MHPKLLVYAWIVLGLVNLCFVVGAFLLRRRDSILPADRLAVLGIVLGLDITVFLGALLFDTSACGDPPTVACIFNQNRGVLAMGAILVAAATIYVNARLKQMEDRQAQLRRRNEAHRMLADAVDELVHNLQHFSHQIDEELRIQVFPATSFEATTALLQSGAIHHLHPRLARRLSTLQRILAHNRAVLVSAAEADNSLRVFSLLDQTGILSIPINIILQRLLKQSVATEASEAAVLPVKSDGTQLRLIDFIRLDERVITHSVRFLMETAYFHGRNRAAPLMAAQFRWLEEFEMEMKKNDGSYGYWYKSSEVGEKEAAGLRARGERLYCWIADEPVDGLQTVSIRTSFRDFSHTCH